MTSSTFQIATLHRGRYMLLLLLGVCVVTLIVSKIPISEIVKIVIVLFSLPILLYISVKFSKNNSTWELTDDQLILHFKNKQETIPLEDIEYIRNLPRSGGNLIMLFIKNKRMAKRYWRNKLFQNNDDLDAFLTLIKNRNIEYVYM